jgi:hypothetical protein
VEWQPYWRHKNWASVRLKANEVATKRAAAVLKAQKEGEGNNTGPVRDRCRASALALQRTVGGCTS